VDLKEIRRQSVTRIQMVQYRVQWGTHVTQQANESSGSMKASREFCFTEYNRQDEGSMGREVGLH
jgi:hypothetical protein